MKRSRHLLFSIILGTIFLFGFLVIGFEAARQTYWSMLADSKTPIVIEFKKNTSASALVEQLASQHLIQSKSILLSLIKLLGMTHSLKAGIYQIQPGESAFHFLKRVAAGDVLTKSFTIVEGTTTRQVISNLKKAPFLSYKRGDWADVAPQHSVKEGLLLADTYTYEAGSDSSGLLKQANESLEQFLKQCWENRSPGLPYKTPYELLIVASILEKETATADEKKLIAGVIVNRIAKKMRLQVDPTVIYGLGETYQGKLTREGLKIDSPYNTYKYRGLPPTPIAMVGKGAILAAAHPEKTDYLYFVAKGDGTHQFSTNYEDQKKAIEKYLKN